MQRGKLVRSVTDNASVGLPEYSEAVDTLEDRANAWVAEFAPLVMDDASLDASEVKSRLQKIDRLKQNSQELQDRLNSFDTTINPELVETFSKASLQLDSLEEDYRKRLAKLSPGDPLGIPDLSVVQERLAERAARQELGVTTDQEQPAVLQVKTAPGNWPAATAMGVFGLGWTAFTTFHAIMMIGGMMSAFGPLALLLLLFYSVFFLVGFGMLAGAFNLAASESVHIEGRKLTVVKKLGVLLRQRAYQLGPESQATIGLPPGGQIRESGTPMTTTVNLTDIDDKPVSLASTASDAKKKQLCDQINSYLMAQGD